MKTPRTTRLPAFFTQVIGSLPRPKLVLDLLARRSEISADRYAKIMDEMVIFAIRLQEQAGLDVVSDGEWRRRHYLGEFLQRVGGFERVWKFEHQGTDPWRLMIGSTGGSLGETAGLIILAGGAYLAWRNYLNWRIPVSILGTVAAASAGLHQLDPARFAGPLFMIFSGGLVLGAVYMATDLVTSPVTNGGRWIFGAGIGALVVLIRVWGGLAEGVMYAILIMNALVPFINRATQPRVFGTRVTEPGS